PAKEVRDLVETRLEQAKTDLLTRSGVMQAPAPAPDLESLRQKLAADLGRVLETRIRESLERDLKRMVEAQAPAPAPAPAAAPAPGGGLTIDQVRETIKSLLGKEAIQESVQKIIQSDLFNNFLSSDQLKEMLDDKFKIMRNWLKNEELPRQLARNKDGPAPDA
ncbi:MAG: hypothetical protein MUC63_03255, partial [Planctomycetes bacterium]|nr:hypothetical protein [Planctomycetota bacterium]